MKKKKNHHLYCLFGEWVKIQEIAKHASENRKLQYIIDIEPEFIKRMEDLTEGLAGCFKKGESLTVNTYCCEIKFTFK